MHPDSGADEPRLPGPADEPTATLDGAASAPAVAAPQPGRLRRGDAVGRYLVLDQVGAGGMGTVYAAYDPELERKVALKLLHAPGSGAAARRLLGEAQALARLVHPNVLTVYDAGSVGDTVFLACELVEGTSLAAWLRHPRRRRELLRPFLAAGHGLAAAHRAGLVHRDFKPANVMVAADGRVLVVDFGLAAPEDSAEAPEGGVLPLGELESPDAVALAGRSPAGAGTPAYMAPEQRAGSAVRPAADQYAFCVALRQALAGAVDRRRTSARLRRILERGTSRRPENRYPSMEVLLAALERDPWRRRRRGLAAAAVVLAAAGAGLAVQRAAERRRQLCGGGAEAIAAVWGPARRQALGRLFAANGAPFAGQAFAAMAAALDRYTQGWQQMHRSACEATRLDGSQSSRLLDLRMACLDQRRQELAAFLAVLEGGAGVDPDEAVEGALTLTPLSRCADARALLVPVPPPAPAVAGEVEEVRRGLATAVALERLGRYADGTAATRGLATTAERLAYWPLTAEVLLRQGILEERSSAPGAADTLGRAVDAAVAGGDDRTAAEALVHLVRVHGYQRSDHDRARYYGRLATAALERLGEPAELAADLADHLGRIAYQEGAYDDALAAHRRALALRRRALGPDHPGVGSTLLRLAAVHAELGELARARRLTEEAVTLYRAAYGEGHPQLAVALVHLGDVRYRLGELEGAEEAERQALAIREATLGQDHLQTADLRLRLANVLLARGDTDAALDALEQVRAVFSRLGDGDPRLAAVFSSLASARRARGELDRARELFRRALALQEKVYGAGHPWIANTLYNLGLVHKDLGEPAAACRYFERSIALWEASYGGEHPLIAHALTGQGQALLALGRPGDALAPLERALALRQAPGTAPELLASTRFTLARALDAAGADRSRAAALAKAALDGFRQAQDGVGEAEVASWLTQKGPSR